MAFDARTLTLPAAAIIAIVGAFVWGTLQLASERDQINTKITSTVNAIERLASSVERLAAQQAALGGDRYTRLDHELWCARAVAANKNWKCPELPPSSAVRQVAPLSSAEAKIREQILETLRKARGK